jgi:uncharacterized FlgJ-related protein
MKKPLGGVVDNTTISEKKEEPPLPQEGKKKKKTTATTSSNTFVPRNKAFEKVRKLHAQMEELDKEIKMLRQLSKLLEASEEICMKYNKMALVDKKRKRPRA